MRRVKQNHKQKQTCCSQTATQMGITCYFFILRSLRFVAKHHINTITPSTEFGLQLLKNPCLFFWCIYYSTAQNIPSGVIQIAHTEELCKTPPPPPHPPKRVDWITKPQGLKLLCRKQTWLFLNISSVWSFTKQTRCVTLHGKNPVSYTPNIGKRTNLWIDLLVQR